jgi:membrane protease subunit (stomatin/prohibitin family)
MAANQMALGDHIAEMLRPTFTNFGLTLDSFVVENLSLPDELQKMLDARVGMNMVGDMNRYTQFQAAQSLPIAAANEGGLAGIGAGLGAGMTMAQAFMGNMPGQGNAGHNQPSAPAVPAPAASALSADLKYCSECGKQILRKSKFCPECGAAQ